jgi:multidrug resistance efflux pump
MKVRFNLPPAAANELNGLSVKYAAAKRQLPRLRWYLLLLLVTAPLLYLAGRILMGVLWDSSPGFVSVPQNILKTGMNGRIEVLVREGDTILAGAIVAKIRPIMAAESTPTAYFTPDAVARLDAEAAMHKISYSAASLRLAVDQHTRMMQRLEAVNRLIAEGAATAAERAQGEAQVTAAKSDLLRAQADANDAQSALRRLELNRQSTVRPTVQQPEIAVDIIAPVAGKVVHSYTISQDWVTAGSDVMLVQRQDEPEIRVFLSPLDENNARIGVRAELRFMDGGNMAATVVKIEPETARMPPDRIGPLATRMQSIVAVLKPDQPLPVKYRINDLPLDVRFNRIWF